MVKKISRREFLYTAALGAASVVLASCKTPEPMPEPTMDEVPATNTPVPDMPAASQYKEAPELAAMVEAGDLPPVDDRLPINPLVLSPIHGIGQYGGRIRSFGSEWGGQWHESQYGHSPLRWVDDGLGIEGGMVAEWESNADASEWTLYFRKGLKWSDGSPCTVDDVMYWWNDLVHNTEHTDTSPDFGKAGTEGAEFIKVDDTTLTIKYAVPSPLTEGRLAMWVNAGIGPRWIAPAAYLKQFHPDYSDATNFEEHDQKMLFRENPDCPTLTSWMCKENEPGLSRLSVRNPYYYAVDTEGNQLPYIDEIGETVVPEKETQILTILNGEIDFAGHIHHSARLGDLATLKEGADAANIYIDLWDCGGGTGPTFFFNNDNPDDALRELQRTPKLKQALSHCLDREAVHKFMYFGYGELTTGTHSPKCKEFWWHPDGEAIYAEHRDAYVAYDIDKAKSLLDEIGMVDASGDGFRDRPDGEPYGLRVDYPSEQSDVVIQWLEIVKGGWEEAGLKVILNPMAPGDFDTMWQAGQGNMQYPWGVGDGPNHLLYPSWLVPNEPARWSPLSGNRLAHIGTAKEDTELDKSPWDRDPPRFASSERDLIGEAVWKLQEIYQKAIVEPDQVERHYMVHDLIRIHIEDGPFFIGCVANEPLPIIVSNDLMNVPLREELALNGFICPWIIPNPALTNPETYAFKNPEDH